MSVIAFLLSIYKDKVGLDEKTPEWFASIIAGQQKATGISIACHTVFLTKSVTNSEKILPPVANWKNVGW